MNIRLIIILLSICLTTGCISSFRRPLSSDFKSKAQNHMVLAEAKANSMLFQDAIKEYTTISRKYFDTNYYKPAVWKLALLNLHPDNPNIDYKAALSWLQIYSHLGLSPEEKENILIYTVLIQRSQLITGEKEKLVSRINQHKKEIASLTKKLGQTSTDISKTQNKKLKKLSTCKAELSNVQKKLSILKNKLEKMKEIDVQMHKTKK